MINQVTYYYFSPMNKRDFIKTGALALGALMVPNRMLALEDYPTTNKVDWAILYGTWCGSSRDASLWISEGMDGIAKVFDVRENPDLSGYKYVVVGGSIRSNGTPTELQAYLTKHKDLLKDKIKGFFIVCGNMKQPVTQALYPRYIDNHLSALTGVKDVPSRIFLGRITLGLMEPSVREQMGSMGEYDNLKRSECLAFGREVLQSVKK